MILIVRNGIMPFHLILFRLTYNLYIFAHICSSIFLYNQDEICDLISHIPTDTGPGPNGISFIMLHNSLAS